MLATILLSTLLWLIGTIYAAIHWLCSVGISGVQNGIILGSTFKSTATQLCNNKFSISLVHGVDGCFQWHRLVFCKILRVWIFSKKILTLSFCTNHFVYVQASQMSAGIKAFVIQFMQQVLVWMQLFCFYHVTHCMSVLCRLYLNNLFELVFEESCKIALMAVL